MTDQNQNPASQEGQNPAAQGQPASNSFTVPDAYKERGWVEKIKSPDDLWKTLDNAQSLLGKRPAGIPANDAPEDEWEKFYQAAGKPEAPDKYQFSDIENLPEGFDATPFKEKAANILHQAGLNQKQADKVWKMFMQSELEALASQKELQAAKDAEFDALTKKHIPDFDKASKVAQDMINAGVPEELRGAYAEVAENPKALAAVISALNHANSQIEKVKKEYGAEGKLPHGGQQAASQDMGEIRKELAQLRTSQAARDFTHPDNAKTKERIAALSAQVAQHYRT